MKILVLSPLYPPDIAQPAPYAKELAKRLRGAHTITVLTYGRLPEQVAGVSIFSVDKRSPLVVRLWRYTTTLMREVRKADVLYVQNGPSVELPLAVVSMFVRRPVIVHIGDMGAHEYAQKHTLRRVLERAITSRARAVVTDSPKTKPELLPLEEPPTIALAAYEESWQNHLKELDRFFTHAS